MSTRLGNTTVAVAPFAALGSEPDGAPLGTLRPCPSEACSDVRWAEPSHPPRGAPYPGTRPCSSSCIARKEFHHNIFRWLRAPERPGGQGGTAGCAGPATRRAPARSLAAIVFGAADNGAFRPMEFRATVIRVEVTTRHSIAFQAAVFGAQQRWRMRLESEFSCLLTIMRKWIFGGSGRQCVSIDANSRRITCRGTSVSYAVAVPEILADADAEAANHSILRTARDEALDVINAPTQALLGPSVDRQRHRRGAGIGGAGG